MSRFFVKQYDERANEFICLHVEGGAVCRVDPLVTCALVTDRENYQQVAKDCVGKTFKTEDAPDFFGGAYLPDVWEAA